MDKLCSKSLLVSCEWLSSLPLYYSIINHMFCLGPAAAQPTGFSLQAAQL